MSSITHLLSNFDGIYSVSKYLNILANHPVEIVPVSPFRRYQITQVINWFAQTVKYVNGFSQSYLPFSAFDVVHGHFCP